MDPKQAAGGHHRPESQTFVVALVKAIRDNKRELGTDQKGNKK